jgi:hypothetical protein
MPPLLMTLRAGRNELWLLPQEFLHGCESCRFLVSAGERGRLCGAAEEHHAATVALYACNLGEAIAPVEADIARRSRGHNVQTR